MFIFSFFAGVASKNIAYGKTCSLFFLLLLYDYCYYCWYYYYYWILIFSAYSSERETIELIDLFNGRVRFRIRRRVIFRGCHRLHCYHP